MEIVWYWSKHYLLKLEHNGYYRVLESFVDPTNSHPKNSVDSFDETFIYKNISSVGKKVITFIFEEALFP